MYRVRLTTMYRVRLTTMYRVRLTTMYQALASTSLSRFSQREKLQNYFLRSLRMLICDGTTADICCIWFEMKYNYQRRSLLGNE
jgi:hypothetical protein